MTSSEVNVVLNVLLVEDSVPYSTYIKELLEEQKTFKVYIANNLGECISRLKDTSIEYDVLLLDLRLPDSRGIETLFYIKAVDFNIPIIVLTGINDEELGKMAIKEGAQDFIFKDDVCYKVLERSINYAYFRSNLNTKNISNLSIEPVEEEAMKVLRNITGSIKSYLIQKEE